MNYLEVKKDIYWVGSLDPELRVLILLCTLLMELLITHMSLKVVKK